MFMNMQTLGSNNFMDVGPDEFPLYMSEFSKLVSKALPQGQGSRTDADTVDGLQAVTATKAGPNKLVATGSDGKLPTYVIPTITSPSMFVVYSRDGLTQYTLVVEADGALSLDPV